MRRSHINNSFSKFAPGRLAFAAKVVKAIGNIFWRPGTEEGDVAAGPRNVTRSGRAAALIIDDSQAFPLAGQAQNRLDEIVPMPAVDPRCAQNDMARVRGDGLFAGKLAFPVDIEGCREVALDVGCAF